MISNSKCCTTALLFMVLSISAPSQADTLLINRIKQKQTQVLPIRGKSMTDVEKQFGAPLHILTPVGGDSSQHPVINRWEYDNFIVYFEDDRVIDSVIERATPTEIGPKKIQ